MRTLFSILFFLSFLGLFTKTNQFLYPQTKDYVSDIKLPYTLIHGLQVKIKFKAAPVLLHPNSVIKASGGFFKNVKDEVLSCLSQSNGKVFNFKTSGAEIFHEISRREPQLS